MKTTVYGREIEYTNQADLEKQVAKIRAEQQEEYNKKFSIKAKPAAPKEVAKVEEKVEPTKTQDAPKVDPTPEKTEEVKEKVEEPVKVEEAPAQKQKANQQAKKQK